MNVRCAVCKNGDMVAPKMSSTVQEMREFCLQCRRFTAVEEIPEAERSDWAKSWMVLHDDKSEDGLSDIAHSMLESWEAEEELTDGIQ